MAKDVTLTAIIKKLQEQKTQVPLVIMTYINPVYQYGIEAFVKDLAETSVKGSSFLICQMNMLTLSLLI